MLSGHIDQQRSNSLSAHILPDPDPIDTHVNISLLHKLRITMVVISSTTHSLRKEHTNRLEIDEVEEQLVSWDLVRIVLVLWIGDEGPELVRSRDDAFEISRSEFQRLVGFLLMRS